MSWFGCLIFLIFYVVLVYMFGQIQVSTLSSSFSVCSVSASLSTWGRPESRSAMHAGSCTAWSMASSPTVRCPPTRPSAAATTPSTPSLARLAPASTYLAPYSLTWSPPQSVRQGGFRQFTVVGTSVRVQTVYRCRYVSESLDSSPLSVRQ